MCDNVVINAQVLSYQVRRQIKIQQTLVQKYVIMSNKIYHAVHFMEDVHTNITQQVQCVAQWLSKIQLKNYIQGRNWCYYRHH